MNNIACNLLYNNGGEDIQVGFAGRCTIENIIYNVRKGDGRWCSQGRCSCRQFYDRSFTGHTVEYPCNESYLFTRWEWNAGENFETEEPFYIREPILGKVAILTTRFAHQPEPERKIVGFFKIDECIDERTIVADSFFRLRLLREEANELNFWEYHRNNKGTGPRWSQGRFRYLQDIQTAAILHDLHTIVLNDESKYMIRQLLEQDFTLYAEKRPRVIGYLKSNAVKQDLLRRKYGRGGESPAHKGLKNHVAAHPELIGLSPNLVDAMVEHPYVSGDLVDILFRPKLAGIDTVVEIELDNVVPGIHQAIKYRALRCSQLGRSLDDPNVRAIVVAWKISKAEAELCDRYKIQYFEIKI